MTQYIWMAIRGGLLLVCGSKIHLFLNCRKMFIMLNFCTRVFLSIHTLDNKWKIIGKKLFKCLWKRVENSGKIREFHQEKNALRASY